MTLHRQSMHRDLILGCVPPWTWMELFLGQTQGTFRRIRYFHFKMKMSVDHLHRAWLERKSW